MRTYTTKDFEDWGRKGGSAGTGAKKARPKAQCKKAALARWAKVNGLKQVRTLKPRLNNSAQTSQEGEHNGQ